MKNKIEVVVIIGGGRNMELGRIYGELRINYFGNIFIFKLSGVFVVFYFIVIKINIYLLILFVMYLILYKKDIFFFYREFII